jgi:acyl dehydratase
MRVLDTSDLDRYVGRPLGGNTLLEPVSATDIRRWVMGMNYPNPLHFDAEYAAASTFGHIVAPQSFTVATDGAGHGNAPSMAGRIEGSHMLFGGDEWWFGSVRIQPGDRLRQTRRLVDYRVRETRFAGPTVFSRGETAFYNQRGELVGCVWATAIRYLAEEAARRGSLKGDDITPTWSQADHRRVDEERRTWIASGGGARGRRFDEVHVGDAVTRRPIGPHTIATFATEWRAFPNNVWGATDGADPGPSYVRNSGWMSHVSFPEGDAARLDPSLADGLYHGPAGGHASGEVAATLGLPPRPYGYGAVMGAWALDYAAHWGGDEAWIRHSVVRYVGPPYEGDITYVDGSVVAKSTADGPGQGTVDLGITMSNQDGKAVADGTVTLALPR